MNLHFEWQRPITLTRHKKIVVNSGDLAKIEDRPGVYYFARNHGDNCEPFYIGETLKLRSRLKTHLDTVRIVDILRGMEVAGAPAISNGPRSFHYAYFAARGKQSPKTALRIAQKLMIREAVAENIPLLNERLVVIRAHTLAFSVKGRGNGLFRNEYTVPIQ